MCIKVHFGALKFLMFLHFLVLQCTTNGANSSSQPLFSNLHAPRIILNPIMTIFKGLQFGLILADFELTVLEYSSFPPKSVFIFGIFMIELVCVRIFSQNKHGGGHFSCAARCRGGKLRCPLFMLGLVCSWSGPADQRGPAVRRRKIAGLVCSWRSVEKKLLVWSVPGAPSKKNCWSGLVLSGPADQRTRTGPNGPADQQIYNTGFLA